MAFDCLIIFHLLMWYLSSGACKQFGPPSTLQIIYSPKLSKLNQSHLCQLLVLQNWHDLWLNLALPHHLGVLENDASLYWTAPCAHKSHSAFVEKKNLRQAQLHNWRWHSLATLLYSLLLERLRLVSMRGWVDEVDCLVLIPPIPQNKPIWYRN